MSAINLDTIKHYASIAWTELKKGCEAIINELWHLAFPDDDLFNGTPPPDFSTIQVKNIQEITDYAEREDFKPAHFLHLLGYSLQKPDVEREMSWVPRDHIYFRSEKRLRKALDTHFVDKGYVHRPKFPSWLEGDAPYALYVGVQCGEHDIGSTQEEMLQQLGFNNSDQESDQDAILKKAFDSDAGVCGGYSVGTHTSFVLNNFERYFHREDRFVKTAHLTAAQFRLFLALHDSGKGFAVKEEGWFPTATRKRKELKYCRAIIEQLGQQMGMANETKDIFLSLLKHDVIGDYLKGNIERRKAVQILKEDKPDCLTIDEFARLHLIFHRCDAGAYKMLRYDRYLFDLSTDTLEYSRRTAEKVTKLCIGLHQKSNLSFL